MSSRPEPMLSNERPQWMEAGPWERIEDYLDHLCAPLVGIVPYSARRELRAEVQAHLLALIDEYEEAVPAPEAAIDAALREHGEPWSIGQSFLDEWSRREPVGPLSPHRSADTLRAFAWFGMAAVPTLLLIEVYALLLDDNQRGCLTPFLMLLAVIGPFISGSLTGITVRVRAASAACQALQALMVVTLGAGLLMLPYTEGLYFALFQLLFWLPAGRLSASLATIFALSWRRQRFLHFSRRAAR